MDGVTRCPYCKSKLKVEKDGDVKICKKCELRWHFRDDDNSWRCYSTESKNVLIPKSVLNFKKRREESGLTVREVEEITGISNAYISQVENSRINIRNVSLGIIEKLNDCYNKNKKG